jgi:hypothetical protein
VTSNGFRTIGGAPAADVDADGVEGGVCATAATAAAATTVTTKMRRQLRGIMRYKPAVSDARSSTDTFLGTTVGNMKEHGERVQPARLAPMA